MAVNPNQRLSEKYVVKDLTPTNTGLYNIPPEHVLNNLKKLAEGLELLSSQIGPFKIASGYRSPEVNAAVGGSPTSRHLQGEAVDIIPLLSTAKSYWSNIVTSPALKSKFGEISWKIPQGSIHLSLPYYSGGVLIKGSPRVAEGSPMVYRSLSSKELEQYVSKGPMLAGIGLPMALIGISTLIMTFVLKRK